MNFKIEKVFILCLLFLGFTQVVNAQTDLISDGSFELGIPNSQWNEFSTNFGTPICNVSACGYGSGTGPRTSNYWAWFGGAGGASEIGLMDQNVTIPVGTAQLHFWLENSSSSGTGNDFIQVQVDDVVVWTLNEGSSSYSTYREVVLDLSSYADGGTHKIEFYSVCYGGGNTNFFVDDVSLIQTPISVPVSLLGISLIFLLIGLVTVLRFRRQKSLI